MRKFAAARQAPAFRWGAPAPSSELLSVIDDALRSLDEVISAEEAADDSRVSVPAQRSEEMGEDVSAIVQDWAHDSGLSREPEPHHSRSSRRKPELLLHRELVLPVRPKPRSLLLARAMKRLIHAAQHRTAVSSLHHWKCVVLVIPQSESPSAVQIRLDLRKEAVDQLAVVEAENRWLRRAVQERRAVYRALVPLAIEYHSMKAHAFRRMKLSVMVLSMLQARRRSNSEREANKCAPYAAQKCLHGALVITNMVSQATLRRQGWAWRQLRSRCEFFFGWQAVAAATQLHSARAELSGVVPQCSLRCTAAFGRVTFGNGHRPEVDILSFVGDAGCAPKRDDSRTSAMTGTKGGAAQDPDAISHNSRTPRRQIRPLDVFAPK